MNGWSLDDIGYAWGLICGVLTGLSAVLIGLLIRERRKSKDLSLSKDSELMASIYDSPISFAIIDREGRFQNINRQFLPFLGLTKEQLLGLPISDILPDSSRKQGIHLFQRTLNGEKCVTDISLLHSDGHTVEVNVETAPLIRKGKTEGIIVFTQDLSERKRSMERIRYMAYYDDMTGLPNRRSFMNRLADKLKEANLSGSRIAVWYMDVDRFKLVNASYGRDYGDMLLLQIAERLTRCFPDQQDLARMEGDEFVGMFVACRNEAEAAQRMSDIMRQFEAPFDLGGVMLYVTISVGLAMGEEADQADVLLKKADTSMHRVKENGRNDFMLYDSEFEHTALNKLTLQHEMIEALRLGQFLLYYQPQYDLSSGDIVGLEALIRWRHPEKGIVPPALFIPAAEESGLIVAMGEWVLREACRQNKIWQDAGRPPLAVSVNLSIRQFSEPDLVGKIAHVLADIGLDARYLKLEITESMTMDVERATSFLKDLKALGVGISVDDFGTGYSSFHYLKRLPIGSLKIDRSFVRDIQQDPNDRAIVAAIIAMAHNLQLEVIAEGVETEEQVQFLRSHRCDEMQGYFGSPPLSPEGIEHLLAEGIEGTPLTLSILNMNAANS